MPKLIKVAPLPLLAENDIQHGYDLERCMVAMHDLRDKRALPDAWTYATPGGCSMQQSPGVVC